MANQSINDQLEKLDPKLKQALIASVKEEISKDVRAKLTDEIKEDVSKKFAQEEKLKMKNDNIKRTIKIKALRDIMINGKTIKPGEVALASEKEAKTFTKPILGKYTGWGEGMYHKDKIVRAEIVK